MSLKKIVLAQVAQSNFWAFCCYMDWDFFRIRRSFFYVIAEAFQRIADGLIKSLAISLPPRAGKSYITTLFAVWLLGRNPNGSVMRNCCTTRLYNKFSYDARALIRSDKFKEVFPGIELSKDRSAITGWGFNEDSQIAYFGNGVDGQIIGFGATEASITDDLYRSHKDALSDVVNDGTKQWYESAHNSRFETGCPRVDIGTRWQNDDVIGANEEKGIYDEIIRIPALTEDGKSFCEDVHTTKEYHETKRITDDFIWNSEYMQQPIDAEGIVFPSKKLERYTELNTEKTIIVAYADTADEGEDRFSMPIIKITGSKAYLIDVIFNMDNLSEQKNRVLAKIQEHGIDHLFIESNNAGAFFARELREKTDCPIRAIHNSANKLMRVLAQSGWIIENFMFKKEYEPGSEYDKFMIQLTKFLRTSKKKDDAPDSLAGLAERLRRDFISLFKLIEEEAKSE